MTSSVSCILLRPIAAFFLLFATAVAAQASCGIEVRYINELNRSVTLDAEQTKVRVFGPGSNPVPIGTWSRFTSGQLTIPAGATRTRTYVLNQKCRAGPRSFKFFFAGGNQIYRVNKWVVVQIDKRFNVRIKD